MLLRFQFGAQRAGLGPEHLVHQLPADVTVENQILVGSLPLLSVKHVTAVESSVAPSVSSPARTQPKRRRKLGNSDCEDSSRPGEMVKCAGPSCCT